MLNFNASKLTECACLVEKWENGFPLTNCLAQSVRNCFQPFQRADWDLFRETGSFRAIHFRIYQEWVDSNILLEKANNLLASLKDELLLGNQNFEEISDDFVEIDFYLDFFQCYFQKSQASEDSRLQFNDLIKKETQKPINCHTFSDFFLSYKLFSLACRWLLQKPDQIPDSEPLILWISAQIPSDISHSEETNKQKWRSLLRKFYQEKWTALATFFLKSKTSYAKKPELCQAVLNDCIEFVDSVTPSDANQFFQILQILLESYLMGESTERMEMESIHLCSYAYFQNKRSNLRAMSSRKATPALFSENLFHFLPRLLSIL